MICLFLLCGCFSNMMDSVEELDGNKVSLDMIRQEQLNESMAFYTKPLSKIKKDIDLDLSIKSLEKNKKIRFFTLDKALPIFEKIFYLRGLALGIENKIDSERFLARLLEARVDILFKVEQVKNREVLDTIVAISDEFELVKNEVVTLRLDFFKCKIQRLLKHIEISDSNIAYNIKIVIDDLEKNSDFYLNLYLFSKLFTDKLTNTYKLIGKANDNEGLSEDKKVCEKEILDSFTSKVINLQRLNAISRSYLLKEDKLKNLMISKNKEAYRMPIFRDLYELVDSSIRIIEGNGFFTSTDLEIRDVRDPEEATKKIVNLAENENFYRSISEDIQSILLKIIPLSNFTSIKKHFLEIWHNCKVFNDDDIYFSDISFYLIGYRKFNEQKSAIDSLLMSMEDLEYVFENIDVLSTIELKTIDRIIGFLIHQSVFLLNFLNINRQEQFSRFKFMEDLEAKIEKINNILTERNEHLKSNDIDYSVSFKKIFKFFKQLKKKHKKKLDKRVKNKSIIRSELEEGRRIFKRIENVFSTRNNVHLAISSLNISREELKNSISLFEVSPRVFDIDKINYMYDKRMLEALDKDESYFKDNKIDFDLSNDIDEEKYLLKSLKMDQRGFLIERALSFEFFHKVEESLKRKDLERSIVYFALIFYIFNERSIGAHFSIKFKKIFDSIKGMHSKRKDSKRKKHSKKKSGKLKKDIEKQLQKVLDEYKEIKFAKEYIQKIKNSDGGDYISDFLKEILDI